MAGNDQKYDQEVAQALVALAKLNYIKRGGCPSHDTQYFEDLETDNTSTQK
tara:strand:- start:548 stop:700 length:153 start_codon:yes stop_codon:yes gene_type:complete